MGRRKQPEIRQELLDRCTDWALHHGLPDRLGAFATGTGVSSRMLVYHFDSRDGLLRAVLGNARQRQRSLFTGLLQPRAGESYPVTLRRAWAEMTSPRGRPYLTMFGRLQRDSENRLWPDFRREATTDWLDPLTAGMGSVGRPELATLVLAVIRGLIMDLEATGDVTRADAAFERFVAEYT